MQTLANFIERLLSRGTERASIDLEPFGLALIKGDMGFSTVRT